MKYFSRFVLSLIGLCCANLASAQTLLWNKKPQWESVEMLGEKLVRVTMSGNQGVLQLSGKQIIPCSFSNITEISNRRFLVLDPDNKIVSIWDDEGHQVPIQGDYYVDASWPFFSDGLLAVRNKMLSDRSGAWGYIDLSGALTIPFKFGIAFPFIFGKAAVCYKKDGAWVHIGIDGRPILLKNQKLRTKDIKQVSSFTQIKDRQLALVCIDDYMYLIDPSGEVVPTDIIGRDGQPLYGAGLGPRIIAGPFMIHFNDIGEISSIKKGEVVYNFEGKTRPKESSYPTVDNINVSANMSFIIGELSVAPQFENVIPISSDAILVEENLKWGLISVNRIIGVPRINPTPAMDQIVLEHGASITGEFSVSSSSPNTGVYYENAGKMIHLEMHSSSNQNIFDVPLAFEDGKLTARIGLMMDGIILVPQDFEIIPAGFKNAYSVSCPASVTVPSSGRTTFKMTVRNASSRQGTGLFDIFVNGGVVKRSISLDCNESIVVPVSLNISMGEVDSVVKKLDVKISEYGCPAINLAKSITCVSELKND